MTLSLETPLTLFKLLEMYRNCIAEEEMSGGINPQYNISKMHVHLGVQFYRQHGGQELVSWVASWRGCLALRFAEKVQQNSGFSVTMCWRAGQLFM